MSRGRKKRVSYQRGKFTFVGAWVPSELIVILDQQVEKEDLDRSKFLRRALDEKLAKRETQP